MKARVKDWGTRLVGRTVSAEGGYGRIVGTLCGFTADGEGIARVMVAFSPGFRSEFAIEDVEEVT